MDIQYHAMILRTKHVHQRAHPKRKTCFSWLFHVVISIGCSPQSLYVVTLLCSQDMCFQREFDDIGVSSACAEGLAS
eukprot:3235362-Amphidinium_carterae.2